MVANPLASEVSLITLIGNPYCINELTLVLEV